MLYTNTFESRQILQSLLPGFLHLATKANPGRHRSTLLYYDFPSQDIILTLSMHSFPHTQLDFRFVHLATISLLFPLAAAATAAISAFVSLYLRIPSSPPSSRVSSTCWPSPTIDLQLQHTSLTILSWFLGALNFPQPWSMMFFSTRRRSANTPPLVPSALQ